MRVSICEYHAWFVRNLLPNLFLFYSTVKDSSVVAVQIFDQRKFKRRDQGFLGVVNVRVSDVLDLELGGHGMSSSPWRERLD